MCQEKYMKNAPIRRLRHPLEESPLWSIMTSLVTIAFALIIGLPVLVIIAVMVPSCLLVRWFLLLIFWNRQSSSMRSGGGPESLRGNDGRWLGSAWRCSVIHAVLVFESGSGLDVNNLRRLLLERVVPLYPRLTRRPVPLPLSAGAGHCWLPDSQFNIEKHVFAGPSHLNTEQQLQNYVGRLLEDGLPTDKPPWELHVVPSYGRHSDTVAILRVHQSVADGMALVRVLCHSLTDCKILHVPQRPHFGALAFTVNFVRACLVGPLSLLFWLLLTDEDCNIFTQRKSWTGKVTVTWSTAITLPKVTRIKQVTRSSVNCVLMSALAGAVRRLMQSCGVMQPPDIKVVLPVDLRSDITSTTPSSRLGSKVAPVVMGLPVSVEGAVPRLWATRSCLDSLRTSADPVVVYIATAALMTAIPGCLARKILSALTGKASLQFSSLPGPPSTLLVDGHPLKGVYPLLPAQSSLGLAVSVFTYADQVYVAAISDSALGPAANILLQQLHAQIEILWKLLLHRRVPGESRPHLSICRPDVTGSPVRELRLRLCSVQKEVQRLTQKSENDTEAARLEHLKTEFSQLLSELQRRHSSVSKSSPFFEDEEVDGELWRPRRRAMSCTSSRRPSKTLSTSRPPSIVEPSSPTSDQSELSLCDNCSNNSNSFSCCQGFCSMTAAMAHQNRAIKNKATKHYKGNVNEDFIEDGCDASCIECIKETSKIQLVNEQAYSKPKINDTVVNQSACSHILINVDDIYSEDRSYDTSNKFNESYEKYKNYSLLEREENTSESEYESAEMDTPDDDGSKNLTKAQYCSACHLQNYYNETAASPLKPENDMVNRLSINFQNDYTAIINEPHSGSSSTKSSPKHQYFHTSFLHLGNDEGRNSDNETSDESSDPVIQHKNSSTNNCQLESQEKMVECEVKIDLDKERFSISKGAINCKLDVEKGLEKTLEDNISHIGLRKESYNCDISIIQNGQNSKKGAKEDSVIKRDI